MEDYKSDSTAVVTLVTPFITYSNIVCYPILWSVSVYGFHFFLNASPANYTQINTKLHQIWQTSCELIVKVVFQLK